MADMETDNIESLDYAQRGRRRPTPAWDNPNAMSAIAIVLSIAVLAPFVLGAILLVVLMILQ